MSNRRVPAVERDDVLVIGLGRFGVAVAEELEKIGHEVLAVDEDSEKVQLMANRFTAVVQADATREAVLKELGASSYRRAVVGIGAVEDSVLCVALLSELGLPEIWAKALSPRHGSILERVGASHVVHPESSAGKRVAHLVSGSMLDFIEFDDDYAIVKLLPPPEAVGRTLAESAIRTSYDITVVGTKRPGTAFVYARPETVVGPEDVLVVAGRTSRLERLAAASLARRGGAEAVPTPLRPTTPASEPRRR